MALESLSELLEAVGSPELTYEGEKAAYSWYAHNILEHVDTLMRDYKERISCLRADIDRQEREIEKLRELLRHMWRCMCETSAEGSMVVLGCGDCPYDNECGNCDFPKRMEELGLEVES